jgi:alkanesulfonate monooxygenase SsuD/methylene tetrahydromethanopterin reductase-like flavin-dependent oxidoreductase (luciferase family)
MAKSAASLDRLSEGRLVLGLGVGNRPDDYAASGADFHRRGRTADAQIEEMVRIWRGEVHGAAGTLGPAPVKPEGPTLLFGGTSEAAWQRVARHGQGWICGLGGPDLFAAQSAPLLAAWRAAQRENLPRRLMLKYFALGRDGRDAVEAYMRSFYTLAPFRDDLIATTPTSPGQVADLVAEFAAVGCDELLLFPCSSSPEQVELLAKALQGQLD